MSRAKIQFFKGSLLANVFYIAGVLADFCVKVFGLFCFYFLQKEFEFPWGLIAGFAAFYGCLFAGRLVKALMTCLGALVIALKKRIGLALRNQTSSIEG